MRILLGAAAALVAIALAPVASANDFYGRLSVGTTNVEAGPLELPEDTSYGAAIGTSIGPFRVEASANRFSGDLGGLEISANDFAATAYLDLPLTANTGVFVGGGADYVQAEANYIYGSAQGEEIGYHYTAGVAHRISERQILEVSYRHLEADFDDFDVQADTFSAGLRFRL